MDRQAMRAELAFILSVREGEADQDFQTARLNTALDRAYERCVIDGRMHGMSIHFMLLQNLTWEADATTFTMPTDLGCREIIKLWDLTSGEPAIELRESMDYKYVDRKTLQWGDGSTGPSADVTIKVQYSAAAEKLETDASEPALIPPEHRMYIVWEAACSLRGIADDQIPQYWHAEREKARLGFIKYVSRPKPTSALALAISSLQLDEYYEEE